MIRKLLKSSIIAAAILFTCTIASAQSKVGYINFEQLVIMMPASAAVSTQLEAYRKSFNDQASTIAADIESKSNILQQTRLTMSDEARLASEQQIQALSQQLQQLQSTAQQSVRAKSDDYGHLSSLRPKQLSPPQQQMGVIRWC